MKGKIDLRFDMPNFSKFRTRLETIPEDLVQKVRVSLSEAVQEVCDEKQAEIKTKLIQKLNVSGLAKKEHEAALTSIVKDFFFTHFAIGAEAARIKFGGEKAEAEAEAE